MDNNVANVLAELRRDHKNMGMMLRLLEHESNLLYAGDEPDFELIHDVMHYMTVYPDAVHHPKENRIYAELKAVRPDLTAGFRRIIDDHKEIEDQSLRLRDGFASIHSAQFVRRNQLVADALRYVDMLRGHMQWEELDLFRRVEEMVRDGHEFIEAATYLQGCDPVFGGNVEQKFAAVVSKIQCNLPAD